MIIKTILMIKIIHNSYWTHISNKPQLLCPKDIFPNTCLQLSVVVTFSTVALNDGSWGMPVEKDNAIINETAN